MEPAVRTTVFGELPRTKPKENADELLVVVDDEELDDEVDDVEVVLEVEEGEDVVDRLEEVGVVLVVR